MSSDVILPGAGRFISLSGSGTIYKIYGNMTGGAYSVVEHPIDPGILIPPHMHANHDQLSHVIEGEIGMRVGNQVVEATPGYYIFKPRAIPHAFWNSSTKPARLIEITSPADFETWFEDLGKLYVGGRPSFDKVEELAKKYHTTFVLDWIPELTAKYNVRLTTD